MISILKNGKYRKIICNCGCEFSFSASDLDKNNQIKCPECDELNTAEVLPIPEVEEEVEA